MSGKFKIVPRTAPIELNGDFLGVEFVARTDLKIKEVRSVEAGIDGSIAMLLTVIKSWNLADEEDHAIPLTAEAMEELPVRLIDEMVTAYMNKIRTVPGN